MNNNDVLRSIRYMLKTNDKKLVEICKLDNYTVDLPLMEAYLKPEDDLGYKVCPHETMAHFLNGLIFLKRGKDESRPPLPLDEKVTHNTVLKKMRVAFNLKDEDILTIFESVGHPMTKTELSSFFRKEDHKNFRECGDQFLRNFLKGLAMKVHG